MQEEHARQQPAEEGSDEVIKAGNAHHVNVHYHPWQNAQPRVEPDTHVKREFRADESLVVGFSQCLGDVGSYVRHIVKQGNG